MELDEYDTNILQKQRDNYLREMRSVDQEEHFQFNHRKHPPTLSNSKNLHYSLKRIKKKIKQKPGIFIMANIHGNEWISNSVALWFIRSLVEGHVEKGKSFSTFICIIFLFIQGLTHVVFPTSSLDFFTLFLAQFLI